jgi:hypothetical protein
VLAESGQDDSGRPVSLQDRDGTDKLIAGSELDADEWLDAAASVCTHEFQPAAERALLGLRGVTDQLLQSRSPRLPEDLDVVMANSRFGFALRNYEAQRIRGALAVADDDPLADEMRTRKNGVPVAVVDRLLQDLIDYGFYGGVKRIYSETSGTTERTRTRIHERWVLEHFPTDHPRTGGKITTRLLAYGYLLHRVLEIDPDYARRRSEISAAARDAGRLVATSSFPAHH